MKRNKFKPTIFKSSQLGHNFSTQSLTFNFKIKSCCLAPNELWVLSQVLVYQEGSDLSKHDYWPPVHSYDSNWHLTCWTLAHRWQLSQPQQALDIENKQFGQFNWISDSRLTIVQLSWCQNVTFKQHFRFQFDS